MSGAAIRRNNLHPRYWTKDEELRLVDVAAGLTLDGWCSEHSWKPGFFNRVYGMLPDLFLDSGHDGVREIRLKLTNWERKFRILSDYNNLHGFVGMDSVSQCLVVMDELAWQNYIVQVPPIRRMRNVPFPYYDAWTVMFA